MKMTHALNKLTNTLKIILNKNDFQDNNKLCYQTDGLAMVAPTSTIISEIFLQNLKK